MSMLCIFIYKLHMYYSILCIKNTCTKKKKKSKFKMKQNIEINRRLNIFFLYTNGSFWNVHEVGYPKSEPTALRNAVNCHSPTSNHHFGLIKNLFSRKYLLLVIIIFCEKGPIIIVRLPAVPAF